MSAIQLIYLLALLAGVAYAVITLVMGDISGMEADGSGHDFGGIGHDLEVGGHEVDTGGSGTEHAAIHFSPFSPLVIASFLAGVGGIGLFVSNLVTRNIIFHLPAALASGAIIGYLIALIMFKLKQASEVSSEAVVSDLVGNQAEVLAGIPAQGLGEIAYTVKGSRYTGPARSADGQAIARNQIVTIKDVSGPVMVVELKRGGVAASSQEK